MKSANEMCQKMAELWVEMGGDWPGFELYQTDIKNRIADVESGHDTADSDSKSCMGPKHPQYEFGRFTVCIINNATRDESGQGQL